MLDLYYTDPAQQPPLTTEDEEPDYLDHRSHLSVRAVKCSAPRGQAIPTIIPDDLDHRSHLSVRAVKCSGPRGQAIPTIIPDDLGDDLSHLCEL